MVQVATIVERIVACAGRRAVGGDDSLRLVAQVGQEHSSQHQVQVFVVAL